MFVFGENPNVFQDKQLELSKFCNDTEYKLNIKKIGTSIKQFKNNFWKIKNLKITIYNDTQSSKSL